MEQAVSCRSNHNQLRSIKSILEVACRQVPKLCSVDVIMTQETFAWLAFTLRFVHSISFSQFDETSPLAEVASRYSQDAGNGLLPILSWTRLRVLLSRLLDSQLERLSCCLSLSID